MTVTPEFVLPQEVDVIVVGAGGSGLACALEAAARGARVWVCDKAPNPGGATAWAVGAFTCSSSEHQARAGVQDSREQHFADMDAVNAGANRPDNLVLRRLLVDQAPDTLRWLMQLGVRFVGPQLETPHSRPRMHNAVPGGGALVYHLLRHCRRAGVQFQTQCELQDLIVQDGRVAGVRVTLSGGRSASVHARQAVVLASGDFSGSRDMRARFFSAPVVNAEPVYPLNTGSPLRLMEERFGTRLVNADYAAFYIPRMRFVPATSPSWLVRLPPSRLVTGLMQWSLEHLPAALIRPFMMRLVTTVLGPEPALFKQGAALITASGKRIDLDLASPARALTLDPGNRGYIVMDHAVASRFEAWPHFVSTAPGIAYAYLRDYRHSRPDIYRSAQTLEALAGLLQIPAATLLESMRAHWLELGRDPDQISGPFYALGPVRGYITITEGGLAVNDKLQVLDRDDQPVPGLWACGSAGQGGVLLDGHGHHLAWAFVSGRHVGQQLAAAPPQARAST